MIRKSTGSNIRAVSTLNKNKKSFSLFIAYLLLPAFSIIYTSCQKEYSYEGGPLTGMAGGTAVYTLESSLGNCSSPLISGTYIAGNALLPSNNIQLRADVAAIGTYMLSTNIANGIQFSTSGNFTATGSQTITLTGSGTPLQNGIFSFTSPVGPGCTFFVTVNTASPQTASFTLEGSPGSCSNFIVSGQYTPGLALTSDNTGEVMVNVLSIGSYSIASDTVDGISFSRSGNFTAPGIQKVILNGSGIPLNSNTLTFTANSRGSACTFSVNVLTLGSPATFILESKPDHTCTGYTVSGTYHPGTPLTEANTMAVKVFVTTPGNFSISTDQVNGMTFSNSGNLVLAGSQIVILTGSGTPVNAGTFTFNPQITGPHPLGGELCTADISVM